MSFMSISLPVEFVKTIDPNVRNFFHYWRYFKELPSTQHYLRDNPLPIPSVCLANQQQKAQGTHLRDWSSTHLGLYFSFSWPKIPGINVKLLTLALTLMLIEYLKKHHSTSVQLKWPNDIFYHQKKLAGIRVDEQNDHFIIGIGLNLETPKTLSGAIGLWPDQPEKAGSIQPAELVAALMNDMTPSLMSLTLDQLRKQLIALPEEQDYLKNQYVVMSKHPTIIEGRCLGIQPDGTLKLLTASGENICCASGHIISYHV